MVAELVCTVAALDMVDFAMNLVVYIVVLEYDRLEFGLALVAEQQFDTVNFAGLDVMFVTNLPDEQDTEAAMLHFAGSRLP